MFAENTFTAKCLTFTEKKVRFSESIYLQKKK